MCIELKSQSDVGMPQYFRQCPDIHSSFKCSCCKGMPKLVEAENRVVLVVAESRICYNEVRSVCFRSPDDQRVEMHRFVRLVHGEVEETV